MNIQIDFDNDSLGNLSKKLKFLENELREEIIMRCKDYFSYSQFNEIIFNTREYIHFWNRGWNILADRIVYENGDIYVVGTHYDRNDIQKEFLSNVYGLNSLQKIIDNLRDVSIIYGGS